MTKTYQGVVDRISNGTAVILVDDLKKEFHYPVSSANFKMYEGLWLDIVLNEDGVIQNMTANTAKTSAQAEKIDHVMNRVRKRKGSKFKK